MGVPQANVSAAVAVVSVVGLSVVGLSGVAPSVSVTPLFRLSTWSSVSPSDEPLSEPSSLDPMPAPSSDDVSPVVSLVVGLVAVAVSDVVVSDVGGRGGAWSGSRWSAG